MVALNPGRYLAEAYPKLLIEFELKYSIPAIFLSTGAEEAATVELGFQGDHNRSYNAMLEVTC